MNYRILRQDELMHHGILGMHWGQRNGPPYPLDAGDHSASERSAGWRKSLDKTVKKEASLVRKKDKNQEKINKYSAKLNTPKALKRAAKAEKYKAKVNARVDQARRAQYRASKGKRLSPGQRRQLARLRDAEARLARADRKNSIYRSKIAKYEYKNSKIDRALEKIGNKKLSEIERFEMAFGKEELDRLLKSN